MEKIEVGEYVRIKDGIIDKVIIDSDGKCNNSNCNEKHISCKYNYYNEKDIAKHSKQLIDLIEVKDLVCFKNKLQNILENEEMIIHIFDNDTLEEVKQAIEKGEIELLEILTREQYMANCFKVGGEDE
ncbi:MAG: hypothetical protein MSA89_09555 [Clostridium sp.]|nr:hypothetical protein [Clostridium sp.]